MGRLRGRFGGGGEPAGFARELRLFLDGKHVEAAALRRAYLALPREERREFLAANAAELGRDGERIAELARAMLDAGGDERRQAEEALRQGLDDTPWLRLLRRFNRLPDGMRFLVELRADLLRFAADEPAVLPLERDLRRVLETWFDTGFLELRRVTWDSPASLLERLAASEAVHTVVGWDDLKDRLDADRRLFTAVHPSLADDPLTFVEVALTRGLPTTIGAVLDQEAPTVDPATADTAVFYSISNVEPGLRGVPFGHFVIRKATEELRAELPQLKTFATISPIPGFRAWLESSDPGFLDGQELSELEQPLLRLCATYLVEEGSDPVLRFHLANGARLEAISWLADRSERGMAQSVGLMAHYRYDTGQLAANREGFVSRGEVVASDAVKRLLQPGQGRRLLRRPR